MSYNIDRTHHHSSILDTFTLSPLPYPVILILTLVIFFLAISFFFTFGDFMEAAEEQISLVVLMVPLVLILIIKLLSSVESFDGFFGFYRNNRHRLVNYDGLNDNGGSASPWGVAALVVLILIMAFFHSTFRDMWRL